MKLVKYSTDAMLKLLSVSGTLVIAMYYGVTLRTYASCSISSVSMVTSTGEVLRSVETCSIRVTVVGGTFICAHYKSAVD